MNQMVKSYGYQGLGKQKHFACEQQNQMDIAAQRIENATYFISSNK